MDTSFLCGLSGSVITPSSPSYEQDRQGFNHAVQKYPLIINYCETVTDVSNAVLWAGKHNIPIRIRSGGHNYEGYSNGNCTLIIDVSQMNEIRLDEHAHTIRIQGGVTNGQLYHYAGAKGYPFPGGTCPTVGVSGYFLGGGWGLSCRNFGLGCDSVREIELINYEGKLIIANENCNQDLFWACRGAGGGNFGIITSILFKLPPPVKMVTLIEIDYANVNPQTQELFLETWQEWLCCADKRMTLISRIYNSDIDGLSMLVRGIFYGEADEAAQLTQSFLDLPGAVYNLQYMTFLEAVTIIGSTYPEYEKFASASRFAYRKFNPVEITELVSLIQNRPSGSVYTALSMYALGGQVEETGINDTAFFHRHAHYIMWIESIWEEDCFAADNSAWIDRQFTLISSLTEGSYVNFPYHNLPCFQKEYYGSHAASLNHIKQKYDPCNVFSFPQGVGKCSRHSLDIEAVPEGYRSPKPKTTLTDTPANYRGFRYVTPNN